ncbi:hypothetical protein [Paraburkholderia aromaticivorans]|uniref:hypothetical protein n=1 Tax=Paraburkholderia aromaticivorans TaxID=2026199 RepID=UPI001455F1A1|nr:hypothetical protein [Paraburkholderia aromaticivorans]
MEKDYFLLLFQQSFYIKNELIDTILSTTRSPPLTVSENKENRKMAGLTEASDRRMHAKWRPRSAGQMRVDTGLGILVEDRAVLNESTR